jgi:hypothetical protein
MMQEAAVDAQDDELLLVHPPGLVRKPTLNEEETLVLLKQLGVEEHDDVTSTVDNLVWDKPELLVTEKQHDIDVPEKPRRSSNKTVHHRNVSAQMARMMHGSAATVVDTHENMAHCQQALGHLIVDGRQAAGLKKNIKKKSFFSISLLLKRTGTGNSEHGATYLRLLVRPHDKPRRLDDHDYTHDKVRARERGRFSWTRPALVDRGRFSWTAAGSRGSLRRHLIVLLLL